MKAILLIVLTFFLVQFSNAQVVILVSSVGKVLGISASGTVKYESGFTGRPEHGRVVEIGSVNLQYETGYTGRPEHGRLTKIGSTGLEYEAGYSGKPEHGRLTKVGAIRLTYEKGKIKTISPSPNQPVQVSLAVAMNGKGKPD